MRFRRVVIAATTLFATQAFAQIPVIPSAGSSGATLQRQIDEDRRRREEDREPARPITEPLRREGQETPGVQPGAESVRFMVREIRFTPSDLLSPEELAAIANEFQGRELSLADLQQVAAKVNELYRKKNIVTAQAVIPPQDVSTGVVTVRLVEGRLGKISLEGNESTNESYIVDRLRLQPADLMELGKLETALVRFNRTNDVQLQAELKPGEQFGTSDLNIAVIEPPRQELRLTVDNFGSSSTGTNRAGLSYINRSLLGFRDDLGLSTTQAYGQESYAATYGFPINTWGGRLNLGYYDTYTAIKNGSSSSLNVNGKSIAQIVSLRQPAYVDSSAQIDVIVGGKTGRNSNWIGSVFFNRTETAEGNVGFEAQLFDKQSNWFVGYTRSFGDSRLTTGSETGDRNGYIIDRGALRYNRALDYGLSFRGNLSWQSSNRDSLPSSEDFFIGGDGSVRGYPVGVYSGATGQVLNLELHHPLFAASDSTGGVGATGFFFVDYGRVKPPPNRALDEHESLTGVGWGMNATLGKHVYARLTFGYGLDEVPLQPRQYEINFQVIGSAF